MYLCSVAIDCLAAGAGFEKIRSIKQLCQKVCYDRRLAEDEGETRDENEGNACPPHLPFTLLARGLLAMLFPLVVFCVPLAILPLHRLSRQSAPI